MADECSRPPWSRPSIIPAAWTWPSLPAPDAIAQEIVDNLEAALEQFRLIAGDLAASG